MKRLIHTFLGGVLLIALIQATIPVRAQEPANTNIWRDSVSVTDLGPVTASENKGDTLCEQGVMKQRQIYYSDADYNADGSIINLTETVPPSADKDRCIIQNSRGLFGIGGELLWSADGNPNRALAVIATGATLEPVAGSEILLTHTSTSGGYYIGVNYDLRAIGILTSDKKVPTSSLQWKLTTYADALRYDNGSAVVFKRHVTSRNGRYLAGQLSSGKLVLLDMFSKQLRFFGSESSAITSMAVSSNGENVAVYRSGNLNMYDTSTCGDVYADGSWPQYPSNVPNCFIDNLYSKIQGLYPFIGGTSTRKARFSVNGASLTLDAAWRNELNELIWQRFEFKPDNYTPNVRGYLAMGDSYSSGEGENFGGTWYEPGTDEQGDKNTYNGRNLCHLSRRSYPYLAAIELGYISNNSETPAVEGDFHSVACSGAKIHNVVGILGEKQDEGNANDFVYTDNQYRYENLPIGGWLPGFEKQTGYVNGRSDDLTNRNIFNPEVITLGIGGNDFDFGGFLTACTTPGTCEQAQIGTEKSERVIKLIIQNKNRLVNTYKNIKENAPDSKVYVHGYPKILNPDPLASCGVNVPFDETERRFIHETTTYINDVIEAAAKEAGVFYVDVEDIFHGRALCDAPQEGISLAMNGVTAGNDIDLLEGTEVFGVNLPQGVCLRGCIGSESMHPNPEGFKLYKEAILDQTSMFTASMPVAVDQTVPVPDTFFGTNLQNYVTGLNNGNIEEELILSESDFIKHIDYYRSNLEIYQTNLLPGSYAEIFVESDPIDLGTYQVNSNGVVQIAIQLPELESGYHEVHIKALNGLGQKVDIYKSFYVAAAVNDFDGDGVLDLDDTCVMTRNVFTDRDGDSIDDACDIDITVVEPPVEENIPKVCTSLAKVLEKISEKADPHPSKFRSKNPNYLECFQDIIDN